MVMGESRMGGGSSEQKPPPRKVMPLVESVSRGPVKKELPRKMTSLLQDCIAGEVARPGPGVSAAERQVWGEVFQSRQHFVDMHIC